MQLLYADESGLERKLHNVYCQQTQNQETIVLNACSMIHYKKYVET